MLMKISKLLVLTALWLTAGSAWAADLVERNAPEEPASAVIDADALEAINKVAAPFVVGDAYVLYNTGAQQYFSQGNNWGTRASVSDLPILVRFTLPEGKTLEDNALLLNDYDIKNNAWKIAFFDAADKMFVDRGSQANYFWQVVPQGDNVYRLQASPANPDLNPTNNPGFVGRDPNVDQDNSNNGGTNLENTYPLSPFLEEGFIDWVFYPVPEWTAYFKEKDVFDKSEKLKKEIETAEAAGIDVAAAAAVYNDLNATVEQMEAAIQALKEAMSAGIGAGTADNPTDATALINNPNFDDASAAGWSGTGPNMAGNGQHTAAWVPEHYNKTFDTYQDLVNMPNGVYGLNVKTFFRGQYDDFVNGTNKEFYPYVYAVTAEADTVTVLFNNAWAAMNTESMAGATEFGTTAAESSQPIGGATYFIPNDPSAFRLYEEKGFYDTPLFFEVTEGTARIGVKKTALQTGSDWAVFDTFSLKYYGNTAASFQKWVDLSAPSFSDEVFCTTSYMEAYKQALETQKATNKAEAQAAIEALNAEAAKLQENISLWSSYLTTLEDAKAMMSDNQYDGLVAIDALADYCDLESEEVVSAKALDNEGLKAEIQKVMDMIEAVKDEEKNGLKDGSDVTKFIVNADLERGKEGWTAVNNGGGNFQPGGTADNHGYEAWHSTNFDFYQEIQNAPAGVYELSVQGYVRYLDGDAAIGARESYPENIPIYVYINDAKTPLANWFDSPQTKEYAESIPGASWKYDADNNAYPDNMTAALGAFSNGAYKVSAYGLVAKAGDVLRVGVKGNPSTAEFWPLWDNFKLTYRAFNPDVVKPALEEALKSLDTTKPMGKNVREKAEALNAAAAKALADADGTAMFTVLSEVYALSTEIEASVALFNKLAAANDNLQNAKDNSKALETTITEAEGLISQITAGINDGTLEDSDVEALIEKVNAMITKLGIPTDAANASDENPVDLTGVIQTPNFEKDGTNSLDGWTASGYNFGNDATQKSALAVEFWEKVFDLYQEIAGLPNGTYKLSAFAFERTSNPAYLYAVSGDNTYEVELQPLGEGDGLPNSMVTAVAAFEEGNYLNELILKVTDEKLRIGIKKELNSSADWVIMDNFQLTYYGTNSSLTPNTGIQEVGQMKAVKTEFFNLNGVRLNKAQKGIVIMKQTMSDGTVTVKKVRR